MSARGGREELGASRSGCFCDLLNINQAFLIRCPTWRMDFISAQALKPSRSPPACCQPGPSPAPS